MVSALLGGECMTVQELREKLKNMESIAEKIDSYLSGAEEWNLETDDIQSLYCYLLEYINILNKREIIY